MEKLKAFRSVEEAEFVAEAALHDLAERYLHLAVEACDDSIAYRAIRGELADLERLASWAKAKLEIS